MLRFILKIISIPFWLVAFVSMFILAFLTLESWEDFKEEMLIFIGWFKTREQYEAMYGKGYIIEKGVRRRIE